MSRKLHIGGTIKAPGWEVLNAIPGDHVDHIGDAANLTNFEDNQFSIIYASHVLEHLDFVDELKTALAEWYRVLEPGGKLYVSVPDMDLLTRMFQDRETLTIEDRFMIMRMLFGGHTDDYDYHMVGLNEEFLSEFLKLAGFRNLQRVDVLGLFEDTSTLRFKGELISLNMISEK